MNSEFVKRRWLEFRYGHSTYLIFLLGFSNFILITYNFIPQMNELLSLWQFGIIFVIIYLPAAVLIGHWHVKKFLPTETAVSSEQHKYRDVILHGKEEMETQYKIWMTDFQIWMIELQKKNMSLLGYLLKCFNAPPEMDYDKELKQTDMWINQLKTWRERYNMYLKGVPASEVMRE